MRGLRRAKKILILHNITDPYRLLAGPYSSWKSTSWHKRNLKAALAERREMQAWKVQTGFAMQLPRFTIYAPNFAQFPADSLANGLDDSRKRLIQFRRTHDNFSDSMLHRLITFQSRSAPPQFGQTFISGKEIFNCLSKLPGNCIGYGRC